MALQYRVIPVTAFEQNCSLVWCDQTMDAAVIDPGGDLDRILATVNQVGVNLKAIWMTHAHIDHAGATADLAESHALPIIGPQKDEQFWIDLLPQQSAMFGFPETRIFVPDRWLEQGDEVVIGQERLSVHHCPGHTPGHVVFFSESAKLAIVGDVLFQGSIGRTDFPKGDQQTLVNAIRDRLFPLGDDVSFIPGHGPMSTIGHERASNPFLR